MAQASASGSSSESVFREAAEKGKLTHLKLLKVAEDRPGRLTSKKLQEFAQVVDDHSDQREWKKHDTPAVAKSYYLRVLRTELPNAPQRGMRELKTLCYALDYMAQGRYISPYSLSLGLF